MGAIQERVGGYLLNPDRPADLHQGADEARYRHQKPFEAGQLAAEEQPPRHGAGCRLAGRPLSL